MGKRLALLACTGVCIAAMASAAGKGQGPKAEDVTVRGGAHSFATLPQSGVPGAPLLQPSGIIFANGAIYVGNESSQNLRPNNSLLPKDAQIDWPALKLFTISRIDAEVPNNAK